MPARPRDIPSLEFSSGRFTMPAPGTIILGKYRLEKLLASGGMGSVFAAHHLLLDQPIAIKCLSPAALDSPTVIERFTREARAAARIASEHVARVIDIAAFDNGLPFIVMEHLEGEDLADHLRRIGPLRTSKAVRFILEACEVLAEAHGAGIVHRDIKPGNLFIAKQRDKRRIIKVLDFGISKVRDEALTDASALLGTLRYMSPEQLRSAKEVDHRTDIWALGAVLYEMLTGEPPFDDSSMSVLVAGVLENNRLPIEELRPEVPAGLVAVVDRCLQIEPRDRYESVLEMARDIAAFANHGDRLSLDTIRRVMSATPAPAGTSGTASGGSAGAGQVPTVVTVDEDASEVTETHTAMLPPTTSLAPPPSSTLSANAPSDGDGAAPASASDRIAEAKGQDDSANAASARSETQEASASASASAARVQASESKPVSTADATRTTSNATPAQPESRTRQASFRRIALVAVVAAALFALVAMVLAQTPAPAPPPSNNAH